MFLNKTLWSALWLCIVALGLGLPASVGAGPLPAQGTPRGAPTEFSASSAVAQQREALLDHNWDPGKLYAILTSSDTEAKENLYRAAFAAGPDIIPKLDTALRDDRTAEFAAQELAFLGSERAFAILANLVNDPRNLDLRRFYYGALGGSDDPRSIGILLDKVRTSDREPDREVTQDAILALSISSDPSLIPRLRQAEKEVTDPVIQDDINTAATVIDLRAKYLASPAGKNSGSSVRQVIRTYFMPALEAPPDGGQGGDEDAQVGIHIKDHLITFSPDKTRALAAVDFETPQAVASYWMVLQKKPSGWGIASVWLGEEREKTPPASPPPRSPSSLPIGRPWGARGGPCHSTLHDR